ncbi:hypothetical protein TWF751_004113 [Orbilia oligospora]|nr:hypothetical protein TWF751_004113 [Orbilia oligospora]
MSIFVALTESKGSPIVWIGLYWIFPPKYKQLGSVTKNGTIPTYLYATSSNVNL